MTSKTRWTLAVLALVAALIAALAAQLGDNPATTVTPQTAADREHRDADTPGALVGPRAKANLPPCPAAGDGAGPAAVRGEIGRASCRERV